MFAIAVTPTMLPFCGLMDICGLATCYCCCSRRTKCPAIRHCEYSKSVVDPNHDSNACCYVVPEFATLGVNRLPAGASPLSYDTCFPCGCLYAFCCVGATNEYYVDMCCCGGIHKKPTFIAGARPGGVESRYEYKEHGRGWQFTPAAYYEYLSDKRDGAAVTVDTVTAPAPASVVPADVQMTR